VSGDKEHRVAIARSLWMDPALMRSAREVSNRVLVFISGLIEEPGDPFKVFAQPKSECRCTFLGRQLGACTIRWP
jgi:ABC-type histidine transport system ATPase subunit